MSKINETNYPRRTQANYADTDMLVIQAAGGNTYTTRLEDMREDYEATLAPTLSALQNDINENLATIEAGSTASKAYAKGDFLVFGGRLCKAKTSIASGATLVLDTNIELDSVGDELSSISSDLASKNGTITIVNGTEDSSYYSKILRKSLGVVELQIYLTQITVSRWGTLISVPDGFKPTENRQLGIKTANNVEVTFTLNTSGNVVSNMILSNDAVLLKFTYIQ